MGRTDWRVFKLSGQLRCSNLLVSMTCTAAEDPWQKHVQPIDQLRAQMAPRQARQHKRSQEQEAQQEE